MVLARWQATIQDSAGNALPSAEITVRDESSGTLAALFSDRDGSVPLGNPFNADGNGFAAFHVVGGAYRIDAVLGSDSTTLRYVAVGTDAETDIDETVVVGPSPLTQNQLVVGSDGAQGIETIGQPPEPADFDDVVHAGFSRNEAATANVPGNFGAMITALRSGTRKGQLWISTTNADVDAYLRQVGVTVSAWRRLFHEGNLIRDADYPSSEDDLPVSAAYVAAAIAAIAAGGPQLTAAEDCSGLSTVDFTGLPSGIKRIFVNLDQVSTSSTQNPRIQIGDSGGLETGSYVSSTGNRGSSLTATDGMILFGSSASVSISGHMILTRNEGNIWNSSHSCNTDTGTEVFHGGGRKELTGELDRLSLVVTSGTFDAGQVSLTYD